MDCRYKEENYCTYSNRDCNPKAYSCYLTHRPKNYVAAPMPKTSHPNGTPKADTNSLFPLCYDKTMSVKEKTVVYVYGGVLNIKRNKLRDYRIIVRDIIDKTKTYSLYVICNIKNGQLYIGKKVLDYYMKKHYHPNIIFKYANPSECTAPISHIDMSEISILKMYGYAVGKSGMSKEARQELLKYILENQIMKGYDMINLLQFNIAMREHEGKYERAINDWSEDIRFITDYFDGNIHPMR